MKTLYLDCGMGAAGDMLTAALLELLPDQDNFIEELNALGIPDVVIRKEASVKCGICGSHICVTVNGEEEDTGLYPHTHHEEQEHGHGEQDSRQEHCHGNHRHEDHGHEEHSHHHSGMQDISHIVERLPLSDKIQKDILAVYRLIAEAESAAHGVPVTEIHFHEVGTMDAIADITAVCMLMNRLAPEQIIVSPIHVGSGHVRCAHGILPIPAPATAYILKNVPIYGGGVKGELCTPTGAALLKYFATTFADMPVMKTTAIGYGMGKKDFEAANCVRALFGETEDNGDFILELRCNLDDMTAEAVSFAMERFFEAGALDVYTVPVCMKKSRQGILLCVMCRENLREQMIQLLFKYTSTIGIRENVSRRHVMKRTIDTVDTAFGTIRKKTSEGYGIRKEKYEFEDVARAAREQKLSPAEVLRRLENDSN